MHYGSTSGFTSESGERPSANSVRNLLTDWLRAWVRRDRERPFRVLFPNGNPGMTPAIRVLLDDVTDGRPVSIVEREDWSDIATEARKHGFDLLLVNFTQTTDRERKGQSSIDFTTGKRWYRKPVVIFTSLGSPGLVARLEAAGADAVIRMPFGIDDVVPVLRKLIGSHSVIRCAVGTSRYDLLNAAPRPLCNRDCRSLVFVVSASIRHGPTGVPSRRRQSRRAPLVYLEVLCLEKRCLRDHSNVWCRCKGQPPRLWRMPVVRDK